MHARQQGFTLVELLIIVAILAIAAQMAIPAWQAFIENNRSQALMHALENAIHQARAQAITRRIPMELCGSQNGLECTTRWSQGWIIRPLSNAGSELPPEQVVNLDTNPLQVQWAGFQPRLIFHANGYSTASNGRFFLCRDHAIDWQLVLNRQGRLRRASEQENREQDHRCSG